MSTQQQRQEWRELAAAAAPGEWIYDKLQWQCVVSAPNQVIASMHPYSNVGDDEPNAAFIAAARVAVPALLADVDALTQERDAYARNLADAQSDIAAEIAERNTLANDRAEHIARLAQERDALAAELERVRAQLDAVPLRAIRKVCNAAELDGYTNDDVDEWLGELEWARQQAHTPTPGTR